MVDLSSLFSSSVVQWAIAIIVIVLVFIIFRYFFHIVMHVVRFVLRFFWHGCFTVIGILILLYILHLLKLI